MSIDIGFLVCSNTTTKTYLQRAKHTFRSVLDSLCLGPHQESHGLMSQGFSSLLFCLVLVFFQIHVLVFPSSGSCWLASRILSIMPSSFPLLCEEIKISGTKEEKGFALKNRWYLKNSIIFVETRAKQDLKSKYMFIDQGLHVCTNIE